MPRGLLGVSRAAAQRREAASHGLEQCGAEPHLPLFNGIPDRSYFYFVHSYHPCPADPSLTLATTDYGRTFCCAAARDNVVATLFPPGEERDPGPQEYENSCKTGFWTRNGSNPAIDLKAGRCVRLLQGDFDKETVFSTDPGAVARGWEQAGAPRIHVVDLEGAASGRPENAEAVARILESVDIPSSSAAVSETWKRWNAGWTKASRGWCWALQRWKTRLPARGVAKIWGECSSWHRR